MTEKPWIGEEKVYIYKGEVMDMHEKWNTVYDRHHEGDNRTIYNLRQKQKAGNK